MARAKATALKTKRGRPKASSKTKAVQNSFASAFGIGAGFFPQNQGSPWTEQVSNVTTGFKNLRWYLVSNYYQFLCQLYAEIGLVQTIVDVPVDDGLRGGVEISSKDLSEDQVTELISSLDEDEDLVTAGEAGKWNRLFGGAGILIMDDDDPAEPFNINNIDKDTDLEFRAVDMWELFFNNQNTEGYEPSIQLENYTFFNYYGIKVHKSRVMMLKGIKPPSFLRPRMRGWGLTIVETLVRSMNQYLKATDLTFEVLDEFKIDVYKMKNLANTLMAPCGDQKVRERIQTANYLKNYQKSIVMDAEDDYQQKQVSFAGLAEAGQGIRLQVASDMRMPLTKIFGISAAGFNSGEDDIEVYNAMVESQVRGKLKYPIKRMIEIKCKKLFGFVPKLTITFKALRVLSTEQEENVKTQKFNRLKEARAIGELTREEFRDACNRGNLFDIKLSQTPPDIDGYEDDEILGDGDTDVKDVDNPGADRADTSKPLATSVGGISKGQVKYAPKAKEPKAFNSARFDKASYEADGGDRWINPKRLMFFDKPAKDPELWRQARDRSIKAYGQENRSFTVWLYKKLGGRE